MQSTVNSGLCSMRSAIMLSMLTIVVYDATDKTFYQFYNQMDSYRIVEFEDDRIVVEAWIYSGGTELGTLGIEDGYPVFIPDN